MCIILLVSFSSAEWLSVYVCVAGQKWSGLAKDRKSRPMQQEDEYRLHMELNRCLKKEPLTAGTEQNLFESQTTRTVSSRGECKYSRLNIANLSICQVKYFCMLFTLFLVHFSVLQTEDVFFSMADMDMSHSLSSLPPLGDPPTVDLDLSLNSNYSTSLGESPSGTAPVSHPL